MSKKCKFNVFLKEQNHCIFFCDGSYISFLSIVYILGNLTGLQYDFEQVLKAHLEIINLN